MKLTKASAKEFAVDTLFDIAGSILFAVGVYTFAKEASFAPGGVTGVALLLNHLWGLPIGTMTVVINIPIALLSLHLLGMRFIVKTVRTIIISSLFLDLVFPHIPVYTGSTLLAAVFSGLFMGAGLAVVFMRGSSTGGTDFLVLSLKKLHPHLSVGQVTLAIDAVILLMGWPVFGSVESVLYGVISVYTASVAMDRILYGAGSGKLAIIITTDGFAVAKAIDESVDRGATIVRAIGAYSGDTRHLVLCVCSKSELFKVRSAAHQVDEGAFVMVTEVSEVFGEGFRPHDAV